MTTGEAGAAAALVPVYLLQLEPGTAPSQYFQRLGGRLWEPTVTVTITCVIERGPCQLHQAFVLHFPATRLLNALATSST